MEYICVGHESNIPISCHCRHVLHARNVLINILSGDITLPPSAGGIELFMINFDLRGSLKKLHGKSFRGMPRDMTMHEPDLCIWDWVSEVHNCFALELLTPGLLVLVLMAMTTYPLAGSMTTSRRGEFTRV